MKNLSFGAGPVRLPCEPATVFQINSGWMYSCVHTRTGERRVVDLLLPGDRFPNLPLTSTGNSLMALNDLSLSEYCAPASALEAEWLQRQRILVERLIQISHGTAEQRVSYLLSELHARLCRNGHCDSLKFELPMSQTLMSDVLAMSSVHLCRTLRNLRLKNCVALKGGYAEILDLERLHYLGNFEWSEWTPPARPQPALRQPRQTAGARTRTTRLQRAWHSSETAVAGS